MWKKRDKVIACKMKKSAGCRRTARKNERRMLKPSEIKREMKNQTEKQEATRVMLAEKEKKWVIENRLKGSEREKSRGALIIDGTNVWLTDSIWLLCCFQITQAVRRGAAFVKVRMEIPTGSLMSWFVWNQHKCGPNSEITCAKRASFFWGGGL